MEARYGIARGPALEHQRTDTARARSAAATSSEKQRLMRAGCLIAEREAVRGHEGATLSWCPSPDGCGFLAGWSKQDDPEEDRLPLDRHGPPWSDGAAATMWEVGGHVSGLALSPSGRFLGVAHSAGEARTALWDLCENRSIAQAAHLQPVNSVGFLGDESAMYSVSARGESGCVVITPVSGESPTLIPFEHVRLVAPHPADSSLVVIDDFNRLHVLDLSSGQVQRTRFVGGRYEPGKLERQLTARVEALLETVDVSAIEDRMRRQQETLLEMLASSGFSADLGPIERIKQEMSRQLEEQVGKVREQLARASTPLRRACQEDRGCERLFRVGFDAAGDRLFVATASGIRVYAWSEILGGEGDWPPPALAVDVSGSATGLGNRSVPRGAAFFSDFDHDARDDRLLFAGFDGRIRFLDLSTGRSGVLLQPPGLPVVDRLGLSRDRTALALTCSLERSAPGHSQHGQLLQIWNYPELCLTVS